MITEPYRGEEVEGREVAWCHDCGTYSFLDEWLISPIGGGIPDACPVCGEWWPAGEGPITDPDERLVAAIKWRIAR